jgi:hypothetical protein
VYGYLDAAENAPRNGFNPQIKLPDDLPVWGFPILMEEIVGGSSNRRRCAASILARHPNPSTVRQFWRQQLSSKDGQIRWWAVIELADAANPDDLPHVMEQFIEYPYLRNALAARLDDWKDRRVVPCLAQLLNDLNPVVGSNAGLSLKSLPFCPKFEPDVIGAEHREGMKILKTDQAAPYLRWWESEGINKFSDEEKWWKALKDKARPATDIEPPWD